MHAITQIILQVINIYATLFIYRNQSKLSIIGNLTSMVSSYRIWVQTQKIWIIKLPHAAQFCCPTSLN